MKQLNHRLDVNQIKTLKDVRNVFEALALVTHADGDHPDYRLLKDYFTIPCEPEDTEPQEARKSLDEIQQELEDKLDALLVKTRRKFAVSWQSAEYRYEQFCANQDKDFEYAKEHGHFMLKLTALTTTLTTGSGLASAGVNASLDFDCLFGSKNGKAGYYTQRGSHYFKISMVKRPSWPLRKLAKALFDFDWFDIPPLPHTKSN